MRASDKRFEQRLATEADLDDAGVEYLECMLICVEAAGIWHDRYVAELARCAERADGMERQRYQ